MRNNERKLSHVPSFISAGFLVFLIFQLGYHHFFNTSLVGSFKQLDQPRGVNFYRSLSLGSDQLMSYILLLGVQLHDNQKGRHINYSHLDYHRLRDWLLMLYELNPQSDYPAFLATRVYSQIKEKQKIRVMIGLVDELFERNPQQHWRRMTEAALLAKHQLQDLPLALQLAQKISGLPTTAKLPFWARDMELVLLDELDKNESAQLLISSMLQSGAITDPDELRFLQFRLLKIQQKMLGNERIRNN